jgi:probable rRNA maturation factor
MANSFQVPVLDEVCYGHLTSERATELCAAAFRCRGFDPEGLGEVSVVLVGREEVQALNLEFRGKDSPTDVLSFEVDGLGGEMVGEVVICPEVAEMGVDELVVHGALHLAGMDHGEDFEGSEMAQAQQAVLEETGAD